MDWATVSGHREGDNPAKWTGNLKILLPAPGRVVEKVHQPALQGDHAAAWFAALRKVEGTPARALEFVALTACRSGEALGATWTEIDFDKGLWVIPASRMKAKEEHRVPLTAPMLALLREAEKGRGTSAYVFPAPRGGRHASEALNGVMQALHAAETEAGRPGYVDRRSGRPAVVHGAMARPISRRSGGWFTSGGSRPRVRCCCAMRSPTAS